MKTVEIDLFKEFPSKLNGYFHEEDGIKRPCVIVCPGGGYRYLTPYEAEPAAFAYFAKGFNVFVLRYPICEDAVYPKPQMAVLKAVSYVKENADSFNIMYDRVVVAGFSAGAHVACSAGVLYDNDELLKLCGTTKELSRPDAMVLIYPCIGVDLPGYEDEFGKEKILRLDELVNEETTPAFIVSSFGDKFVCCNQSLNFARALSDNNVPFELHIFEPGDHGSLCADNMTLLGDSTRDIGINGWFKLCNEWLRDRFSVERDRTGRIIEDYFAIKLMGC